MKHRTPEQERRSGSRLLVIGTATLVVALALWWLVARTNSEGDHDAELLPLFALIPLLLGVFHLVRSRHRSDVDEQSPGR
jgi:hypothetical protein